MNFITIDDDGYVNSIGAGPLLPKGAIEGSIDMSSQPNKYCKYHYATGQWVDTRTPETQWPLVRIERNKKLLACDWTQLSDIPAETKALWQPYRQALRDVTSQPDPFNIVWPTRPTA